MAAEAKRFYQEGRAKSHGVLDKFEQQIAASDSPEEIARLKIERRRLLHYAEFPFDQTLQQILAGLDQ